MSNPSLLGHLPNEDNPLQPLGGVDHQSRAVTAGPPPMQWVTRDVIGMVTESGEVRTPEGVTVPRIGDRQFVVGQRTEVVRDRNGPIAGFATRRRSTVPPLKKGVTSVEELILDYLPDPDTPTTKGTTYVWLRDDKQFVELTAARESFNLATTKRRVGRIGWGQDPTTFYTEVFFERDGAPALEYKVFRHVRAGGRSTATLIKTVTPPTLTLPGSSTWITLFNPFSPGSMTTMTAQILFPLGTPTSPPDDTPAAIRGLMGITSVTLTAALEFVWSGVVQHLSPGTPVSVDFYDAIDSEHNLVIVPISFIGSTCQATAFAVWSHVNSIIWTWSHQAAAGSGSMNIVLPQFTSPDPQPVQPLPALGATIDTVTLLTWDDKAGGTWLVSQDESGGALGAIMGTYELAHLGGGGPFFDTLPALSNTLSPSTQSLYRIGSGPGGAVSANGQETLLESATTSNGGVAYYGINGAVSPAYGETFNAAGLISPQSFSEPGSTSLLLLMPAASGADLVTYGRIDSNGAVAIARFLLWRGAMVRDVGSFDAATVDNHPSTVVFLYGLAIRVIGPGLLYVVDEVPAASVLAWPPRRGGFLNALTARLYPDDAPLSRVAFKVSSVHLSDRIPAVLRSILNPPSGTRAGYLATVKATRMPARIAYHFPPSVRTAALRAMAEPFGVGQ